MAATPPPVSRAEFKVQYFIDEVDFVSMGIYVRESSGILDQPKRKIPYRHSWDDEDGEQVDLSIFKVEAREFKLECFVVGETIADAKSKIESLFEIIDSPGVSVLEVRYYGSGNSFFLNVFREEAVKVVKKFRYLKNVWTFTLTLKEYIA